MGSGGKFRIESVPVGTIAEAYAAVGNLRDAIEKTESLIDRIGEEPDDPKVWEGMRLYQERLKSRSMTLVRILGNLIRSQEK